MLNFTLEANLPQKPSNKMPNVLVLPMGGVVTRDYDTMTSGQISKAILATQFKGQTGELLEILSPSGVNYQKILIYGVFNGKKPVEKIMRGAVQQPTTNALELGGKLASYFSKTKDVELTWVTETGLNSAREVAEMILGFRLRQWSFSDYLSDNKKKNLDQLKTCRLFYPDISTLQKETNRIEAIYHGSIFTRQLVSEPANILTPIEFAKRCQALTQYGLKVKVLGEKAMTELGMRTLLAVGQGSEQESQLVVLEWQGGKKDDAPIGFIGKGVCFDTGGISLKPAGGMEEMIFDMGGAGTVAGLMQCLAMRRAAVNAVGILGLVENMPDGKAQRPGDIVRSMSGQTVEVLNTDAEGRLVLADVLWYAGEEFKPKLMIDLATLTGAIIISLGHEQAGLFCNDVELTADLMRAAETTGERVWPMPLSPIGGDYDQMIDSNRADIRNIGPKGIAGSITAAQFLQRFVRDIAWAHLDIAGVVWQDKDTALSRKGATGYGVRLLNQLVEQKFG